MAYTVKQLAELSDVSVRTLHYYDEIGLLKPAYYGDNGYRYYEREQLLQLQSILFYRELDVPLADLQRLLAAESEDKIQTLHEHRRHLLEKKDRLEMLVATIDSTIRQLKGDEDMSDKELYRGFDAQKQEQYEREMRTKYGDKPVDESTSRLKDWNNKDYEAVQEEYDQLHRAFTQLLEQGLQPSEEEVQKLVKQHYDVVSRFYDPSPEMYSGLGDLYVEHPDFRKLYDSYHPRLADYMRQAMRLFAARMQP
ncbi:MerR family transcriptional regulator [Paenibacillus sambharensis]|uniref:MerR family transcriptional regulator n=1 Tax=Paenibacillus sambharensis TaxID=1803190 RepID=A0A2W1L851_9BACL|nr:MerR family transcriptional regulator [Paenibacillus sambharensis]PZD94999.1 MerR family transcriptional regulator [Paenibacillus sambharensis]